MRDPFEAKRVGILISGRGSNMTSPSIAEPAVAVPTSGEFLEAAVIGAVVYNAVQTVPILDKVGLRK